MDDLVKSSEKWEPFEQPLFDNPKARDLSRVGVIDIGSNSIRLVVFDGAARSPAYFFNEKVMCALGAGLAESGKFNPDGRIAAILHHCQRHRPAHAHRCRHRRRA